MTEPSELLSSLLEPESTTPAPVPEKVTPAPDPIQPEKAAEPVKPAPEPEPETVETLKAYAARTGVKVKDLYALTLSNGQTLSAITDRAKDLETLDTATVEQARKAAEFAVLQLEFNQNVADWSALVQQGQATPAALERLQRSRTEHTERARAQTVELIPAWKDATVMASDKAQIGKFLSGFNFTEAENSNIVDPRTFVMLQYILTLDSQFRAALGKVERVKSTALPAPGKPSSAPAVETGLSDVSSALLKGLNQGMNRAKS